MNRDKFLYHDSLRVSSAGFIHLRILAERLEYLYGVLPVTPVFQQNVAERIADTITVENRNGFVSGAQMIKCVKHFYQYLQDEAARLHRNITGFGPENSGATYILKQIKNTIDHYENPPSAKLREQNQLDV